MKESELKKKMQQVEGRLKRSKLVDKCIRVVKVHSSNYREKEHRYHVEATGVYSDDKIRISYHDGWTEFGGGKIEVSYQHEVVLHGQRNDKNEMLPHVSEFEIDTYKPGDWEKIVKDLARRKPVSEKPKKPVKDNPELSDEKEREYKERFSF